MKTNLKRCMSTLSAFSVFMKCLRLKSYSNSYQLTLLLLLSTLSSVLLCLLKFSPSSTSLPKGLLTFNIFACLELYTRQAVPATGRGPDSLRNPPHGKNFFSRCSAWLHHRALCSYFQSIYPTVVGFSGPWRPLGPGIL